MNLIVTKKELIHGMSHSIATLLTSIVLHISGAIQSVKMKTILNITTQSRWRVKI